MSLSITRVDDLESLPGDVRALRSQFFVDEDDVSTSGHDKHWIFRAEESGHLVGYAWCCAYRSQVEEVWVLELLVDQDHRLRGVGGSIMRAIARDLTVSRLEANRVKWNVNPENLDAIAFYEALGISRPKFGIWTAEVSGLSG